VEILKVSSKSNPNAVAGAMAGVVRQAGAVEVQVVGAGALNQAIKAVAIARNYVASAGLDLVCSPTFADISIDGEDRTGIHLLVESRNRADLPAGVDGDEVRLRLTAATVVLPPDRVDAEGTGRDGGGRDGGGRDGVGAPASRGGRLPPTILQG
jgi:stage V sporulation protein S